MANIVEAPRSPLSAMNGRKPCGDGLAPLLKPGYQLSNLHYGYNTFAVKLKVWISRIGAVVGMLLIPLLISFWMSASIWTGFEGHADAFQRLGSFGVFSWLLLLAFSRVSVERSESNRIKELERQIEKALLEERLHGAPTQYRSAQVSWHKEKEKFTWRQRYLLAAFELIGIGIGTLQWGYGDLLIVALHAR